MIKQSEVIDFFDRLAPTWDPGMIRDDEVINIILDNAGVAKGSRVLDVACGTGVLIPDYLKRGVSEVVGIDISPGMIKIAGEKYNLPCVTFICGDAETENVGEEFDAIVVYNAFPHFPNPAGLVGVLSHKLKAGGILTVAHGMSRQTINSMHNISAGHVSNGLMEADELANIFARHLDVKTVISNEKMYQVAGGRR